MNTWDNEKYQRIEVAKLSGNSIEVLFENGDEVRLSLKTILPQNLDEENFDLIFYSYEIILISPSGSNEIKVPWSQIRVLTDVEFSKHMALESESQANEVGKKLRELREWKNIKANELAERASVTPQTISRIERGHTDISFATLKKILAAMALTLKDFAEYQLKYEQSEEKNFNYLLKKLNRSGIDTNFFLRKLIPRRIDINEYSGQVPSLLLDEITTYLKAIFNWSNEQIWGPEELTINVNASKLAFYKRPAHSNFYQIQAYSHYAYYLSKLVIKSTINKSLKDYPDNIEEFRLKFGKGEKVTFEKCLSVVWDLGICVVPLRDKGLFHGASWNIGGRHVIILKQTSSSQAKWLFDLLHELYHVFAHLEDDNSAVIESEEINPWITTESIEEAEANSFAHKVLFDDKTEQILSKCLALAKYKVENLKRSVEKVAIEENIGEDVLSNYLAYRLSLQGENWWGTANSLQKTDPDPYSIAKEFIKNNLNKNFINPIEANILTMALED